MALLERNIMIGANFGEPTTIQPSPSKEQTTRQEEITTKLEKPMTSQNSSIQEYPAMKVKEFWQTSEPGDIFNTATLEIKRNNKHEALHFRKIEPITNINDASTDLIMDELNANQQRFKPAPRRSLSQLKYTAVSLFTSIVR